MRAGDVAGLVLDPDATPGLEPQSVAERPRSRERRDGEAMPVHGRHRPVEPFDQLHVALVRPAGRSRHVVGPEQRPVAHERIGLVAGPGSCVARGSITFVITWSIPSPGTAAGQRMGNSSSAVAVRPQPAHTTATPIAPAVGMAVTTVASSPVRAFSLTILGSSPARVIASPSDRVAGSTVGCPGSGPAGVRHRRYTIPRGPRRQRRRRRTGRSSRRGGLDGYAQHALQAVGQGPVRRGAGPGATVLRGPSRCASR